MFRQRTRCISRRSIERPCTKRDEQALIAHRQWWQMVRLNRPPSGTMIATARRIPSWSRQTPIGHWAFGSGNCNRSRPRPLPHSLRLCGALSQLASVLAALGGGHIVDLISHATDVLVGGPLKRLNAPVLLSMMLDHIDRHNDDPSLSAATLAQQFHCSERYVHKLFSKTGRSVGEHVYHKRILVCTRDLLGDSRNRTVPLIIPKGIAAHLSAPNQLILYESRDNTLGNALIEDRL